MFLKHIDISQVRSIDHIALDFGGPSGSKAKSAIRQRTVLLGENGCGKSTALRAIALVLAGSDALNELLKEPARWVRNGKKEARISAVLATKTGQEREISLTLRPEWTLRQTLSKNEKNLHELDAALAHSKRNYFTLGYGVTRRPAYSAQEFSQIAERGLEHPRARGLATMFSPEATLVSFEQWAMDMDYRSGSAEGSSSAFLRSALAKLLPGMEFDRIDRKSRELFFKTADGAIPFKQLSDGYQNMANWCGDVLYRITNTFEDYKKPLATRGVLLIDELDLHLHPVWQRKLLDFIGAALPNMQLIATSHSPMVAQQLRENELYVVERPGAKAGSGIRAVPGDPSQLGLSQLMSPMFGIDSPESERVEVLRSKARTARASLSRGESSELAELAPLEVLPTALQRQLLATTELTEAVARASGGTVPKLDLATLRQKIGQQIKSAALRVKVPK
jgi:predicted ATPase